MTSSIGSAKERLKMGSPKQEMNIIEKMRTVSIRE